MLIIGFTQRNLYYFLGHRSMSNFIEIQSIILNVQMHLHLYVNARQIHTQGREWRGTFLHCIQSFHTNIAITPDSFNNGLVKENYHIWNILNIIYNSKQIHHQYLLHIQYHYYLIFCIQIPCIGNSWKVMITEAIEL